MTPRPLDPATVQGKLRLMRELLTQLVDLAASVNAHLVTALAGKAPAGYRSSFADAHRLGVLPADLAERLQPSVGLRDILVHEYAAVDLAKVASSVSLAREQYGDYVRSVARWLLERDG